MLFFRKNKRQFGSRIHRKLFVAMIFVLGISAAVSFIMNANAQLVPVRSIEITSANTSFEDNEPGSWKITKSAEWKGLGKAKITFEVESIMKFDKSKKRDIVMVIDNSGSMVGEKIRRVKADASDLIENLLADLDNRVALVTFESESVILSDFTNNKSTMLNLIDSIEPFGNTNYYEGLLKAEEVLDGYEYDEGRELILLFLTDGCPNEGMPNEIGEYKTLKATYPYMTINGIQYEMGDAILQPIINVSDNQFIADMDTLNNILYEASIVPYIYKDFVITDYINDDYWTIEDLSAVWTDFGSVSLDYNNTTPKVTWDMSGLLRSGQTTKMTIDINLKPGLIDTEGLLLPTNKREKITSDIDDGSSEEIESTDTPILKNIYDVIYEANTPAGCELVGTVPEKTSYTYSAAVRISDNVLSCQNYTFKGWEIVTSDVELINDDYFRIPGKDVYISAVWTKLSISKSIDGTVHESVVATLDWGCELNEKLKKLSGQSNQSCETENNRIRSIQKADRLASSVNVNNDAYVISEWDSLPIYAWYDEGVIYYYTDADVIYMNEYSDSLFYNMRALESVDISNWNTSNVVSMEEMFYQAGYDAATFSLNLSGWDTSNVTNIRNMFYQAGYNATTFSLDLSGWDTSNVDYLSDIFTDAGYSATTWSLSGISNWNLSKVTDLYGLFSGAAHSATSFELDLSNWNVSKVENMGFMFYDVGHSATTWSIVGLSDWDVSSVTNMDSMFINAGYNATTFSLDLSGWDVSNNGYIGGIFTDAGYNATTFSLDLSDWNTSTVTSMDYSFQEIGKNAENFSLNLSGWDTSNVTDMNSLFYQAASNATTFSLDLSSWNTSNVTNMREMFALAGTSATTFSLNLSGWDTSNVTDMDSMFYKAGSDATTWSVEGLSSWNTSNVTSMNYMFYDAGRNITTFSLDLSSWNTSNVTDMGGMFCNVGHDSTDFSLNLSGWDLSNVTEISNMLSATGFNADNYYLNLSDWNVSNLSEYDIQSTVEDATMNSATGTFSINLSNWNTSNLTNMYFMFAFLGRGATDVLINLSGWDTSNVTSMESTLSQAGYGATNFSLDLSGWDTSNVTNMDGMLGNDVGYGATTWLVTIPADNGGGIANTTTALYGNDTSIYAAPENGMLFTLAMP